MEQMVGLIVMIIVVAILMSVAFRKAKIELQHEEALKNAEEERILLAHTMPCGVVIDDNHLLKGTDDDFDRFDRSNLMWLINYVGHKCLDDSSKAWRDLMDRLTAIKLKNKWW